MKESVVVFGATSFIGRNLIERLLELDYDVTAVCRLNSSNFEKLYTKIKNRAKYVEVDICDDQTYHNLSLIERCDFLFLASWAGSNKVSLNDFIINRKSSSGLMKCLEWILNRITCKKIIMFGTQAEYGLLKGVVTEDTTCKPISAYGKEKLRFYNQASAFCREKGVTFLEYRIHSIYGPERGGMIGKLLLELSLNNPIVMQSNCEQKWDFVYIDDFINALLLGIEKDLVSGCYNISSGQCITLKEYIEKAKKAINPLTRIEYGKEFDDMAPNFEFDSSKFRIATDWTPRVKFKDGVIKCTSNSKEGIFDL